MVSTGTALDTYRYIDISPSPTAQPVLSLFFRLGRLGSVSFVDSSASVGEEGYSICLLPGLSVVIKQTQSVADVKILCILALLFGVSCSVETSYSGFAGAEIAVSRTNIVNVRTTRATRHGPASFSTSTTIYGQNSMPEIVWHLSAPSSLGS